jgi:hypothetical protein
MKKVIFFLSLSMALFTTSCSQSEADTVEPTVENTQNAGLPNTAEFTVVRNFVDAINSQNRTAARALLATESGYAYGDGALRTGQNFDNWLESDLYSGNARIVIESATQNGNQVNMLGRWGRNGNATNRADYRFVVRDGLIQSWRLY